MLHFITLPAHQVILEAASLVHPLVAALGAIWGSGWFVGAQGVVVPGRLVVVDFSYLLADVELLAGGLELVEHSVEVCLYGHGDAVDDVLDFGLAEPDAQLLEHLGVEGEPVGDLLGGGAGCGVAVQFHVLGPVVLHQLGHHDAVREVPVDVLLGAGEGNAVHHLVDLPQLVLLHACYSVLL